MPATEGNSKGMLSVLVVCREEALFLPGADALREEGFELQRAPNVYRAIADFARRPTDIAISDLDSLQESELQFIRILRELSRDVFVLGVFSPAYRARAAEALRLGADACLLQPFYPGEVLWILRRWADRAAGQKAVGQGYQDHLASLARLAKGTAHEINNPLTTLSGWLQIMESEEARPPEERQRLASMMEEADRIAKVVERLQAFGEQQPQERGPVNINKVLSELVEQVRRAGPLAQVESELRAEGALVWGDESQIRKACSILLDDALAALNGEGTVCVRTRLAEDEQVEVSVSDNGRQIVADRLDQVFEPYAVLPRLGEEMSLAYPVAYGIFRSHGGELSVTSEDGRGTEFRVRLPRVSTAP